jgi:hypothetical protein
MQKASVTGAGDNAYAFGLLGSNSSLPTTFAAAAPVFSSFGATLTNGFWHFCQSVWQNPTTVWSANCGQTSGYFYPGRLSKSFGHCAQL